MFDSVRPALVIARREVRDQFRDWRIIFPIVALTLFFPVLMNFTAQEILKFVEKYGAEIIAERLVPFLLMIVGFFPISVSLVIALETFVGEKERGSIEPLLNTPLKDWQLYLGKLLSSTVPPLVGSYLGMGVYLLGLYWKGIAWPNAALLLQIITITTVQAVVMVSGAVVVSSQATSVRAANLLSSFIIIPMALLIQGESIVMFWGDYGTLWWAVVGLLVLGVFLVRVGLAHFQREELLGREIDVLNLRWMWRVFWRSFTGNAHNLAEWYRRVIPSTLVEMKTSIQLTSLLALAGFLIGYQLIRQFNISIDETMLHGLKDRINLLGELFPVFSFHPVLAIWWQNARVLILAMLLGVFSIGVLGVLPLVLTMGVAGYLMAILTHNGFAWLLAMGFILPHGVLEIPIVVIATAAVLRSGALLGKPDSNRTVGEVYLVSLADWLKIMLGLVLPLLMVAAMIEVWATPRILMFLLK